MCWVSRKDYGIAILKYSEKLFDSDAPLAKRDSAKWK